MLRQTRGTALSALRSYAQTAATVKVQT